jgi:hypothetical protein
LPSGAKTRRIESRVSDFETSWQMAFDACTRRSVKNYLLVHVSFIRCPVKSHAG